MVTIVLVVQMES